MIVYVSRPVLVLSARKTARAAGDCAGELVVDWLASTSLCTVTAKLVGGETCAFVAASASFCIEGEANV